MCRKKIYMIYTFIFAVLLLFAGCTNENGMEQPQESFTDEAPSEESPAVTTEQDVGEGGLSQPQIKVLELEHMNTYSQSLANEVNGLAFLRYKEDGELLRFDLDFNEYYMQGSDWPHHLRVASHINDTFLLSLFMGSGGEYELLFLRENDILYTHHFDSLWDEKLIPKILTNGLIAYGADILKTQYKLTTPDLQEAVKLQFDYGEEIFDEERSWGYEFIAVSIAYDEENDEYILVYTTNPWLYDDRLEDNTSNYYIPYSIGIATFDSTGNKIEDLLIPVEERKDWVTEISRGVIVGDEFTIYNQDGQLLLKSEYKSYCYEFDLALYTYRIISDEEFDTLFPPSTFPECPLTVIVEEDGVNIFNSSGELIFPCGFDRNPVCYSVADDGTCYVILEIFDH